MIIRLLISFLNGSFGFSFNSFKEARVSLLAFTWLMMFAIDEVWFNPRTWKLSVAELLLLWMISFVWWNYLFLKGLKTLSYELRSFELFLGDCLLLIFDILLERTSFISCMFCLMKFTLCCCETLCECLICNICLSLTWLPGSIGLFVLSSVSNVSGSSI